MYAKRILCTFYLKEYFEIIFYFLIKEKCVSYRERRKKQKEITNKNVFYAQSLNTKYAFKFCM